MTQRRREPKPPDPIPGVEIRPRKRRGDGQVYYEFRVRWRDPANPEKRPVEGHDTAQLELPSDASVQARELAQRQDAQDALDFKAHLRLLQRRGKVADLDRGRVPLVEFASRWLREWAAINLTKPVLGAYVSTFDLHIGPRIGRIQVRHITPAVVDQLKTDLTNAGVGAPTIIKALSILQGMMRQAVVWGEIDVNPVREVKKPSARRTRVIHALSVEQVEVILAELERLRPGGQARMLAELLAYGAGRPQDVLALPWSLVSRQTLVYAFKNVDGLVVAGAKTGSEKSRSVTMLSTLRSDLLVYRSGLAGSGMSDLVIPRADGEPWKKHDYNRWATKSTKGRKKKDGTRSGNPGAFAQAAAAAGVPNITPYFLRHTYASLRLAEQKLSLKEIADEMGHDVEQLATIYAHVISEYRGQGPIDPDKLIGVARSKIAAGAAVNRKAM